MRVQDEGAGPGRGEVSSGTNKAGPLQSRVRNWMRRCRGERRRARDPAAAAWSEHSGPPSTTKRRLVSRVWPQEIWKLSDPRVWGARLAPGRLHLGVGVPAPPGWEFMSASLGPLGSSALRFPGRKGYAFSKSQQDTQHQLGSKCNERRPVTAFPGTTEPLWAPTVMWDTQLSSLRNNNKLKPTTLEKEPIEQLPVCTKQPGTQQANRKYLPWVISS